MLGYRLLSAKQVKSARSSSTKINHGPRRYHHYVAHLLLSKFCSLVSGARAYRANLISGLEKKKTSLG